MRARWPAPFEVVESRDDIPTILVAAAGAGRRLSDAARPSGAAVRRSAWTSRPPTTSRAAPRIDLIYHLVSTGAASDAAREGAAGDGRRPGADGLERVARRQLARARSVGPVWRDLHRAPAARASADAGRLGRAPAAQGLPGAGEAAGEDVPAAAADRGRVPGQRRGGPRACGGRRRQRGRARRAAVDRIRRRDDRAARRRCGAGICSRCCARSRRSREAFGNGQALLVFGNGGSAADAQHFVDRVRGPVPARAARPCRRWR